MFADKIRAILLDVAVLCWVSASVMSAGGANVGLAWNANPEANIAGYKVYYGTNSGRYTTVLNVGKVTTAVVSNLQSQTTYYFALTAYNSAAVESDFSVEVAAQISGNQRPTLNPIASVSFPEDTGPIAVALSGISSGAGETQPLTITARSSNPTLLPNPVVNNYNSTTGEASLLLQSAPNAFGSAVVTVTVNDNQPSNNIMSRSFIVTVQSENDPPQLAIIHDQALELDSMPRLVFLSGISSGAPNEAQALSINAVSDNPEIIRDPLVFDNGAATAVLVLEPAGTNGTAQVTVTISDGLVATSRTFSVLVTRANDPPSIAVASDQTVPVNEELTSIPLMVSDEVLPAENLVVTATSADPEVLASEDIAIEGAGSSRTLKLRHGRGRRGHARIIVAVNDGQAITTMTLDVNVPTGSVAADEAEMATSVDDTTIPEIPPGPPPESISP